MLIDIGSNWLVQIRKYQINLVYTGERWSHWWKNSVQNGHKNGLKTLLKDIRINYDLIGQNPHTIKEYIVFLKDVTKVNAFFD